MLKYFVFGLFLIVSIIHLVDSWRDDAKRRAITKPFLLILVAIYYVISVDKISIILLAALLTSWLGDVLLIPKGNKWFTMGGISFLFSHFLFIAVYAPSIHFAEVPWGAVIPVALVYYGISFCIIWALRETTPKMMVVPMYGYLLANSTMNIFALMQLLTNRNAGALVAYLGAILFFISDCTLFLVRYYKKKDVVFKKHFTVMLTYIAGEFMITLGIIMLTQM